MVQIWRSSAGPETVHSYRRSVSAAILESALSADEHSRGKILWPKLAGLVGLRGSRENRLTVSELWMTFLLSPDGFVFYALNLLDLRIYCRWENFLYLGQQE